jgi:DNA-directed RNA polymerase subunit N (RpoN/RPB10)
MYPYVVCFCGRSIGDLYDIYKAIRIERIKEAYAESGLDIDPGMWFISDIANVEMGDVLDSLNLYTGCCRSHMIAQTEFKEYY